MKIEWLKLNEKQTVVLTNPNGQYAADSGLSAMIVFDLVY